MPNRQHLPWPSADRNQSPRTGASPDRSKDELSDFIDLFDSHDDSNKVYCNINQTWVDFFLEVTIFQGSGFSSYNILDTKVYFKDTDIHKSLHKKFFHPKHRFEEILKSLLIRFLTQFPHGMNNVRKHYVVITFPFSWNVINTFKITKNIHTKLQAMYPNIFKGELMCSFERFILFHWSWSYLVLVPLSTIFWIFHDVLKSDLCFVFLFVAAFDISRNHSKQAFYLSKHHHRQFELPFHWVFLMFLFFVCMFFSISDNTPALLMFLPIL